MDKGTKNSEFSLSLGVWRPAVCCSSPTFLSTLRHSLKIQITSNASHWESLGNVFRNYPINTKYNAGGEGGIPHNRVDSSSPSTGPSIQWAWHLFSCEDQNKIKETQAPRWDGESWKAHYTHPNNEKQINYKQQKFS